MKPNHEKRTIRISFRVTEEEQTFLADEADLCGLSVSSFLRQRGLGKRVSAKTDLRVLSELRRIGGLLKHIHNESKGAYSAKTSKAIDEISNYVHKMNEEFSSNRNREQ
ncbi:MobB mobilization protein [Synergistaceae bacterium OttesenSCG-928-I11]|nr:MobB mobilization protein [Synergistaceae bacterium OttesenSCG-928-I11]